MRSATADNVRIAILYPGDRAMRDRRRPDESRFANLFAAFAGAGAQIEPAVYHDDFADEVRRQLLQVDAVLVWSNPIEGGRDRTVLDTMLRDVASAGVFVSTHPDIILKLGTKDTLYTTRELGWGCDTHRYDTLEQLKRDLPNRLSPGKARVLKQRRGHSGDGVWRVERATATTVRVRHAKRGSVEEELTYDQLFARFAEYFAKPDGRMIDQEYQDRLTDGMVRCYLVHDVVAGLGVQAINALFPAPSGAPASAAPAPSPRLYHPPTLPEYQRLRRLVEAEWVPALQRLLSIETTRLPVLWDCDFLYGRRNANGEDTYVLCEINVSSVAPFPESAIPQIVAATIQRAAETMRSR